MSDVYIVGVDMIRFGRFPHRTVPDLAAEAVLLALGVDLMSHANPTLFIQGDAGIGTKSETTNTITSA